MACYSTEASKADASRMLQKTVFLACFHQPSLAGILSNSEGQLLHQERTIRLVETKARCRPILLKNSVLFRCLSTGSAILFSD